MIVPLGFRRFDLKYLLHKHIIHLFSVQIFGRTFCKMYPWKQSTKHITEQTDRQARCMNIQSKKKDYETNFEGLQKQRACPTKNMKSHPGQ